MMSFSLSTVVQAVQHFSNELANVTTTPRLEAEVLLAKVLNKSRAWLLTWPEYELDNDAQLAYKKLCQQRLTGKPIAYLLGEKEFWGMSLKVTSETLIPRPETECLVEYVFAQDNLFLKDKSLNIADLGTGSGAIVLALAKERPHWSFVATDKYQATLDIARDNAHRQQLNSRIKFIGGDWLQPLHGQTFDLIISNPPYIAQDDACLTKNGLGFEPSAALVSGAKGTKDLEKIIMQSRVYLKPHGWLILEHGSKQGVMVRELLQCNNWQAIKTHCDYAQLERFTVARI